MISFRKPLLISALCSAGALLAAALPSNAQTVVVRAERIHTVSDCVLENGMILIQDGKISRVGRDLDIPPGAQVLDAEVVIPGLVDMHTHVGVYSLPMVQENSDGNESTNPLTPEVRALDSIY